MDTTQIKYCANPDMHNNTYRQKPSWFPKPGRFKHLLLKPNRFSKPVRFLTISHFFALALIITLFSACEKDETQQVPPKIKLLVQPGMISSDTTMATGDLMTFAIEASGGSTNLTNLIALKEGASQILHRALDTSMNTSKFSIKKTFTKSLDDYELWTFIIRDKNRLSDSVSVIVHRDTMSDFGPIIHYGSLTLSAQGDIVPGSFFSFISSETYWLDEAFQNQDIIDLVYYFGEDENTIASPGANIENGVFEGNLENWDIRRTTRFILLDMPQEVFDSAQNDSLLIVSYTEGSGNRKAKLLTPQKTFSFKTQDYKYGIFRVVEVEGTNAGHINIEIKIQDKD